MPNCICGVRARLTVRPRRRDENAADLNAKPLGYSPEARRILESVAHVDERAVDRGELLALVADYDALIVRLGFRVDREVFEASPACGSSPAQRRGSTTSPSTRRHGAEYRW